MSRSLKQLMWRVVNSAVLPQATNLVELFKSASAGEIPPEEQLPPLSDLTKRAELALSSAKPEQPPPLDIAILACFNSFEKVFKGIRLKFFFYLFLNAALAILTIGLFVVGATIVLLAIRDNLDALKTILGSAAAISGFAGTLYTNPVKMVFKAALVSSQVNLLCQKYQLMILACKANKNLTDNIVLQAAIDCVGKQVVSMFAQLDELASKYDK